MFFILYALRYLFLLGSPRQASQFERHRRGHRLSERREASLRGSLVFRRRSFLSHGSRHAKPAKGNNLEFLASKSP